MASPHSRSRSLSMHPDPAVFEALKRLGIARDLDTHVDLWHATSQGAADVIERSEHLEGGRDGVAFVSSSSKIADLLHATGKQVDVLLRVRLRISDLEISRDWSPDARVDFYFLDIGGEDPNIEVLERRSYPDL